MVHLRGNDVGFIRFFETAPPKTENKRLKADCQMIQSIA